MDQPKYPEIQCFPKPRHIGRTNAKMHVFKLNKYRILSAGINQKTIVCFAASNGNFAPFSCTYDMHISSLCRRRYRAPLGDVFQCSFLIPYRCLNTGSNPKLAVGAHQSLGAKRTHQPHKTRAKHRTAIMLENGYRMLEFQGAE